MSQNSWRPNRRDFLKAGAATSALLCYPAYAQKSPPVPLEHYQAVYFYIDDDQPDFPDNYNESTCTRYELPLVKHKQQENGEWGDVVTLDSLFKFASRSISDIDGGEIVLAV